MNNDYFFIYPEPERPRSGSVLRRGEDMLDQFMETIAEVLAAIAERPSTVPAAALVWLAYDQDTQEMSAHCQAVSYHAEALGLLGYLGGSLLAKQTIAQLRAEGLLDPEEDDDGNESG